MNCSLSQPDDSRSHRSPRNEALSFLQPGRGLSDPRSANPQTTDHVERQKLERLAQYSSRHADELRRLKTTEAETKRERGVLEWASQFSTECEGKLRSLRRQEVESRDRWPRVAPLSGTLREVAESFDASKHPRGGYPENRGWFSPAGGGGSSGADFSNLLGDDAGDWGGSGGEQRAFDDFDNALAARGKKASKSKSAGSQNAGKEGKFGSKRYYLPSDDKGKWLGEKGNSLFELASPVTHPDDGRQITTIRFIEGVPDLSDVATKDGSVDIILSGRRGADIDNAKSAWARKNIGKEIPEGIFHHDLLRVTEHTLEKKGKKMRVLVGTMQRIPTEIHSIIFHQGSASVARDFYEGLNIDRKAVAALAEAAATTGGKIVEAAAKKIKARKIPKAVKPLVGRKILRLVTIGGGSALAVLEFADNVKAHGVEGALIRATPVLGDLVAAHDFGSDLAKQITDEANADLNAHRAAINEPVTAAWKKASEQTIEAFRELAPKIEVTNDYGGNRLVDANEISEALTHYRKSMHNANWLKSADGNEKAYESRAAAAKQELKERLIKASQKHSSPPAGDII